MSPDAKHQRILSVAVQPGEVDAGCRLSLTVHAHGLRAEPPPTIAVVDGDGAERTRAVLVRHDNGVLTTGQIIIAAPRTTGRHVWRAIALVPDAAGTLREEAAADVRFTVVPHTLDLDVWDLPPVVVAGRPIRVRAGIKCSGECAMGGQTLSVADAQGRLLASTAFTDERWPETEPIYAAEVAVAAPAALGRHAWQITATADSLDLPHATASQQLIVTVVARPDCEVTVEVRDRETQAPLAGASVGLDPYQGTTNADGIATVPVAKGQYELLVDRRGYKPFATRLNVRAEIYTMAVLEAEPPPNELNQD